MVHCIVFIRGCLFAQAVRICLGVVRTIEADATEQGISISEMKTEGQVLKFIQYLSLKRSLLAALVKLSVRTVD